MPDPDVVADIKVVYQDPFHFKNLYKLIFRFLLDHGYLDKKVSPDTKMEILYSEQVRSGDVKEYHIWWRTKKQPKNSYFLYKIDIDYLGLGVKNTEVLQGDKKHKMQIGEITILLKGTLMLEANDSKGKWETGFLRYFRNWFRNKWYHAKIEQHEDELYEDVYKLQSFIKEYLELKQFGVSPEIFFKRKGFE
ncbi:hypothetical protein HN592_01610 [Candidatus Woesearchaeota archaeon]|jgi:hypothetical protein|nr:hypothetical protein [Candidatus Woesearchaeota archaeon]MBT4368618.1 hypothetical protein [Candidatus Woesearchaeota archaeon]MBT4713073.1 hypothetical protein [Candidatus Woesearchaeota archaeon]MBT6638995.1 hypothetical protein [Candidatus Woesearchaeota archaeon]MBT7134194.1 hypothetical protein [Candidatus Woesearchaeota archaeon]